jgi:hypothetical protein
MVKHLYLIILLTFITGFATGIYGYFMTRSDDASVEHTILPEVDDGYEILVTVYGGCARIGCASFRLIDDGSYTYLAPQNVRDYARFEDVISSRQQEVVTNLIESTPFDEIMRTVDEGTCPVAYDGIAYRFDIRVASERYSFDSCVQSLDNEPLFLELVKYIDIMEATHTS